MRSNRVKRRDFPLPERGLWEVKQWGPCKINLHVKRVCKEMETSQDRAAQQPRMERLKVLRFPALPKFLALHELLRSKEKT